jgi:hypothetical protein
MKFLIQTIDNEILHDFSFTLIESCRYQKWLGNIMTYELSEDIKPGYIPIGSVDFVSNYLSTYYQVDVKPRNIPIELMDNFFSGRKIINGTEKDINGEKFVKSNDKIKLFTDICSTAPIGNYQISDIIDIESEWRVFVYNGKMVGLQNYSGDFAIFPNIEKILKMIHEYKSQPIAYTLDVAISNDNTVIIEVHDFFSCGLYGFSDHRLLPFMFSKTFYSLIK